MRVGMVLASGWNTWTFLLLCLISRASISRKPDFRCVKRNGQLLNKMLVHVALCDSWYRLVRIHTENEQGQSYPQISCARQQQSCWYRELEISNNVSKAGPFIPQWTSGGSFARGWGSYPFMPRTPAALTEVLPWLVPELLMVFWTERILETERREREKGWGNVSAFILYL